MEFPNPFDLSPNLLSFLNENFKTREDLSRVPTLVSRLKGDCVDLDRSLLSLQKKLSSAVDAWISRSSGIESSLRQINHGLESFDLCLSRGEKGEMSLRKIRKILHEELPLLAKEMVQIETIRAYAETTLKLEALVGDLEDAVAAVVSQRSRNVFAMNFSNASSPTVRHGISSLNRSEKKDFQLKQEKLLLAIKVMKEIEEVLVNVAKSRSKWSHLLKAVDSRVDKSLAILRPQALADHRSLLASLKWPPPLSSSSLDKEESLEIPNPLLLMHGDKKERYTKSFLTLCALQHFQAQRELRKQDLLRRENGHSDSAEPSNNLGLDCSLWTIDELVSPIASRTEHHFSRWSDQPKFMFALVYKITRDFIGVDDVLQPLIDKARLVGYSAREAWVSAMVKMLSGYLSKRIFSVLAERYHNRNRNSEMVSSWLHLIDLIISFDKQMQVLASSGTRLFVGESAGFGGFSRGLSVLSIFCDRPEWLDIWAAIELKDAEEKLKTELADDKAWTVSIKKEAEFVHDTETESFLLSTREDYKAPLIVESVVQIVWTMIERCQMLPSILLRVRFIRSSVSRFLHRFFNLLLHCSQELESLAAYVDDDAFLRIAGLVNAACYCESVLQEWSERIDFLEMRIAEGHAMHGIEDDPDWQTFFFVGEINTLMKLETEWVEEILAYILRQFNILCWDYIQSGNQWEQEEEDEESGFDVAVSVELVEALDALRDMLRVLKMGLNSKDFLDLWRSVAGGLDHFMFSSILLSGVEFSSHGIRQFRADMQALFLVFRPFCARPEGFFPCISNSMKLLEMGWGDVKHLLGVLSKGERRIECLQRQGVFHVSPAQAEKILRNRKFGG